MKTTVFQLYYLLYLISKQHKSQELPSGSDFFLDWQSTATLSIKFYLYYSLSSYNSLKNHNFIYSDQASPIRSESHHGP